MAKLVFELNQSLDGYVDHQAFGPPDPSLFRHFTERVRGLAGMAYGRGMYQVMRYWDEDRPEWDADEREYAAVWRNRPKWVVSRSLKSVGPNASLIANDIETAVRGLKTKLAGEIEVAGPELAQSLTNLGLIDEYRLYIHPVVLGRGKPFFAGPRPRLRLVASDVIVEDVIRLTYVPAWLRDALGAADRERLSSIGDERCSRSYSKRRAACALGRLAPGCETLIVRDVEVGAVGKQQVARNGKRHATLPTARGSAEQLINRAADQGCGGGCFPARCEWRSRRRRCGRRQRISGAAR